ncbi:MerR family transcriptional regulator [Nesterenkonia sp. HG001]|uniref:MerR family transcriptional regulator n=1 Tax=Nesterenkonia sp. HG001 TaxID=2983207 RepID=UPI002AC764BB|nr:MerR family transcriptional regulator [Nesterenkonia sp. HG001]MDZ5076451.1 MerR family transcriptional regulator [Nesterenkonia sp. HG001]
MDQQGDRTMHIGELAERTGLSLRSIRHYGDIGLLPASGRTEAGYRLFSEQDLQRLLRIRRLKPLGFSLDEIGEVLSLWERGMDAGRRQEAAETLERLRTERARLARSLAEADAMLADLESHLST